jgi:O-antigen/teichoic acid export membrane protein
MFRLLRVSEYLRHVVVMATGTGLAQLIPIVVSPVITRMYEPGHFGVFALFMAIVSIAAIFATGRFENAILIAEDEQKATNIVAFCLLLSGGVSVVLFGIAFVFGQGLANAVSQPALSAWLLLVPLMVFITAANQVMTYWFNRTKDYRRLARNRVVRSIVTVVAMLSLGAYGAGAAGIILATIVGLAWPTVVLLHEWNRRRRLEQWAISRHGMLEMVSRYRNFGIFSVWGDTVNAGTWQMPVLVLTGYFGPIVVGWYNLVFRLMVGPASVISGAIGDVFRQRAADDLRTSGNCRRTWRKTFFALTALSLPVYTIFAFFAPQVFAFVFGEPWRQAGVYAQVLTPLFLLSFSASPLSRMMQIAEKQRQDMIWQLVLFAAISAALFYGATRGQPVWALGLFSAAFSVMYVVYLWMSFEYSRGRHDPSHESKPQPSTVPIAAQQSNAA